MANKHAQVKVLKMSCVLNENSDLLLLNSYVLSLRIQYVKEKIILLKKMIHVIKAAGAIT